MRKFALLIGLFLVLCAPALAQDTPQAEVSAAYSFVRTAEFNGLNFNGGSASVAWNANHWAGLVGDFGGYRSGETGHETLGTFLFGPRFSYRKLENARATAFVQALFGAALLAGDSTFAASFGTGLDLKVNDHIAIRVIQAEYLLTHFSGEIQNNARISAGIVFRIGRK